MPDKDFETAMTAVSELQTKVVEMKATMDENKDKNLELHKNPEFKEFYDKVEKDLEAQEEKSQEALKKLKESEVKEIETKERIDTLELELAKASAGGKKDYKQSDRYKALKSYFQNGKTSGLMTVDEVKILRTDIDPQGGYLIQDEFESFVTKTITEISAVRSFARIRSVSKKSLELPIRSGIPTATYEGEAAPAGTSQSSYSSETVNAWRLTVKVPVTNDQLMDSNFDMENEISVDVGEAFAFTEGNKFVLGTGVKQPEGFMTNATLQTNARETTASGSIAAIDIINLTGDLKLGQNPILGMNRQTLALLRTLQTTNGAFIWHSGSADQGAGGSIPNQIAGTPYAIFQDMASVSAANFSVVYADFRRGYLIIDRAGIAVIRDEVTSAENAIINFTFHKYNTGQLILEEAFKYLKIAA